MSNDLTMAAELLAAAKFREKGWEIYFPQKDHGFDFMAYHKEKKIIRPVQVKGKYPEESKKDKTVYGFKGALSTTHDHMALVVVYFDKTKNPVHFAYLLTSDLKTTTKGETRSEVATIKNGKIEPRQESTKLFNDQGLDRLASN